MRQLLKPFTAVTLRVSIVFLSLMAWAAWAAYSQWVEPEKIVWDLRDKHSSRVHWPASMTGPYFERKGNFDLTVLDGYGAVIFHERAYHLNVVRKGDLIDNSIIQFGRLYDGEKSYLTAKKILSHVSFPPEALKELEEWHSAIKAKTPYVQFCLAHGGHPVDYPGYVYTYYNLEFRITRLRNDPSTGDTLFALTLCF